MDERAPPVWLERLAIGTVWASAILGGAGGLLAAISGVVATVGAALALAGLAAGLVAAVATIPIATLRHLRADVTGGSMYDRLRGQRPLRVSATLLSFLVLAGVLAVLLTWGSASGIVGADFEGAILRRALLVLVSAIAITAAVAHIQSLRTPTDRDRSGLPMVLGWLAFGLGILALVVGGLAWAGKAGFLWGDPGRDDVPAAALAGFVALAFGLARTRTLPGLPDLLAQGRDATGRATGTARNASIIVPAILAFALLLGVFLLVLLFGIGVGDLLVSVGSNPLLLGILIFLVVALLASLGIGLSLARSAEKEEPLFRELTDAKRRTVRLILIVSGTIGGTALVLALLAFNTVLLPHALWLHLLCLGLLVVLGPYGFYANREHNRIRRLEERFPDFLRDIASSHKGGLTLHQSVTIAARGEYGPLTPEVRKMADQLSWNVSFQEALQRFAERVETPLVQRAVSLILEADRSGGATTDVLLAAARDAREIKNLENERRLTMSLYTVVVYVTFFVFLGVAAVLYARFAPQIVASATEVAGLAVKPVGGLGAQGLSLEQYRLFYFSAAVVQGIGDGILAGLLGTGKAGLGLRHSFLMVLITYVTFALLLA